MNAQTQQRAVLTEGAVGRQLIRLTIPMIFGLFSIVAFNLADTYFVSKLGTEELAAMGFTFPVVMIIGSIALGLGTGAAAVISRAIGENDRKQVQRLTTDSLFLSVSIVCVIVLVGLLTIEPVFSALGAEGETLALIKQYMTIWYFGMIFLVVPMVGNNAIRASGDMRIPGMIMMVGATVNVILDPILIFGLFGLPRWELAGAAAATVMARTVTLSLALWVLHFKKGMLGFYIPRIRKMWDSWKKILFIGIPAAGTNLLFPFSMGVMTRMVAEFGTPAVAAVGAGVRIEGLALLVVMSLATVLVPYIGQNWGGDRMDRVHLAKKYSHRFSIIWGLFCLAVFFLAARPMAKIFSNDPLVVERLVSYLRIVPLGYGFLGISRLVSAQMNGINRPYTSAWLNLVWLFIFFIPSAFIGAKTFGLSGLFFGIALANILAGVLSLIVMRRILKKGIKPGRNMAGTREEV